MTIFVVQRDTGGDNYPAFSEIVSAYKTKTDAIESANRLNKSPFDYYCVTEIEVK